jgi:hypothetical protein
MHAPFRVDVEWVLAKGDLHICGAVSWVSHWIRRGEYGVFRTVWK